MSRAYSTLVAGAVAIAMAACSAGQPAQTFAPGTGATMVAIVLPAIHSVAVRLVGLERVKEIARPAIWMMPRTFYTTFCAVMAVALGGTAVMVARRRGRGNRRAASDPASRAALIARF